MFDLTLDRLAAYSMARLRGSLHRLRPNGTERGLPAPSAATAWLNGERVARVPGIQGFHPWLNTVAPSGAGIDTHGSYYRGPAAEQNIAKTHLRYPAKSAPFPQSSPALLGRFRALAASITFSLSVTNCFDIGTTTR